MANKEMPMTNTEVISTLREAELLAYKIADDKHLIWTNSLDHSLGQVFNTQAPEGKAIWRDVCIAYNHFKAIDLNILVDAYNKYITTPVKYHVQEVNGCGHIVMVCHHCPAEKGICATLSPFEEKDNKSCEHNKMLISNYVDCSYKKELEK